jgi:thiamine pyrophosphokinase
MGRHKIQDPVGIHSMKRALILANGKPPSKRLFKIYRSRADWFICADGGANTAARFGSIPHLIIGDLDSVHIGTLIAFSTVRVKKLKEQNSTDLEKALKEAVRKKCTEIVVLGATGGRLDHVVGNLSALVKYSRNISLKFVDDYGELLSIGHALKISLPLGTCISLVPLSRCSGIVTRGLKWILNNETLQLGVRESTSNVVTSSRVHIKVRSGDLLAFVLKQS